MFFITIQPYAICQRLSIYIPQILHIQNCSKGIIADICQIYYNKINYICEDNLMETPKNKSVSKMLSISWLSIVLGRFFHFKSLEHLSNKKLIQKLYPLVKFVDDLDIFLLFILFLKYSSKNIFSTSLKNKGA